MNYSNQPVWHPTIMSCSNSLKSHFFPIRCLVWIYYHVTCWFAFCIFKFDDVENLALLFSFFSVPEWDWIHPQSFSFSCIYSLRLSLLLFSYLTKWRQRASMSVQPRVWPFSPACRTKLKSSLIPAWCLCYPYHSIKLYHKNRTIEG